jgi:RNA polymerase sigma-70 factor, ECF subfamily
MLTSTSDDGPGPDELDLATPGTAGPLFAHGDDAGALLDGCRQYLLMIANEVVGMDLRAKVAPSDLVQETFLEAQRHLHAFRGQTRAELYGWLRKILECQAVDARRAYMATEKRDARREVAIETLQAGLNGGGEILISGSPSPSHHAARSELAQSLDKALAQLPEHYRQAVMWRHHDQLAWDEIGRRMGCTADAARKVWSRAMLQLRQELAAHGSIP